MNKKSEVKIVAILFLVVFMLFALRVIAFSEEDSNDKTTAKDIIEMIKAVAQQKETAETKSTETENTEKQTTTNSNENKEDAGIKDAKGQKVESTITVKGKAKKTNLGISTTTTEPYEVEVTFDATVETNIQTITFADLELSVASDAETTLASLQIDTPPTPLETPVTNTVWANVYAIDPSALPFTEATVTVTATGTSLYKCKEWNFSEQTCEGTWTLFQENLVPGETYTFTLTPDDPGFGEIVATDAMHLDGNYTFISNIYTQINETDGVWSEPIYAGEIVRVTFAENLTEGRYIDIYATSNSTYAYFEIYEAGTTHRVGRSGMLVGAELQYILVSNLTQPTDIFDFKMVKYYHDPSDTTTDVDPTVNSFITFDYIHDDSPINTTTANGLLAYAETTIQTPRYRVWNDTNKNFTPELTNTNDNGGAMQWVVTRANHERDEIIVGAEDTVNDVNIQIVNSSRNWTNLLEVSTNVPDAATRGFDIAVEDISGDVLIVYENDTTINRILHFRIWNGSNYSAEQTLNTNISGAVNWVKLVPKMGSDEIMLLAHNSTITLWAIMWNGTDFVPASNRTISTATASGTTQHFEFAWEHNSGDGLLVYGVGTNLHFRNYTRATTTWSDAEIFVAGQAITGARLCSDLTSDYIGVIFEDSGADINVRMWNGTDFLASPPTEDNAAEINAANNVNVDCAWNPSGTVAKFGYIDANLLQVSHFNFTKPNNWSTTTLVGAPETVIFAADDIGSMRFTPHPTTDEIMIVVEDILEDLSVILWNGTDMKNITPATMEGTTQTLNAAQEDAMFDWDRFDPAPNVTALAVNPSTVSTGQTVNITVNVTDNIRVDVVLANITHANGTVVQFRMTNITAATPHLFNLTFTNTNDAGIFNVTIIANDTSMHRNINATERTNFTVTAGDNTRPAVNNVRPVANNFTATNSVVNISANVTDNVAVDTVRANVTFPNGSVVQLTLVPVGTIYNFSFGNTSNEGYYNVTFIANDTSNNINSTERTNFTVDVTGPNVTGIRPIANTFIRNGTVINISANVTDQFLTVDVVLANITYPDNSTKEQLRLAKVGNIYNFSFGNTTFQEGTYNITFIANDTAGNLNTTQKTNFTIDIRNPIVNNVRPVANNFTATNSVVNISANVTNGVGVDTVRANVTFPNGSVVQLTLVPVGTIYNFSFGNTSNEGYYNITFIANDTVGNINSTERTNFTVDVTGPNVTVVSPLANTLIRNGTVVNVSANVTDQFLTVDVVLANITYPDNSTKEQLRLVKVGNIYNFSFGNTTFQEGTYNITFIANDTAGNLNTTQKTNFTIDARNPVVNNVRPVANNFTATNSIVNISANVTDNIAVDTVRANVTFPNGSVVQLTLVPVGTIYNFSFGNTSNEGYYNVTFIANDTAGNINSTERTNFTVDVTGPNVTTLRPIANSNQSNGTVLNISATVTDQFLAVDVVLANITYPDNSTKEQLRLQRVGNIYNFSFRNTTQTGTYNITFIANDTAGNLNTTERTNITMVVIDVANPVVLNVRPVANNFTATNSIVNISANVTDTFAVDVVQANVTFPNGSFDVLRLQKVGDLYNFSFGNTSNEGYYNITFIANDTSNNINNTERTNFTVDSTGPNVTTLRPVANSNQTPGTLLNISATVTDQFLTVDVVLANITYPNNSTKEQVRLQRVGNIYNYTFPNTSMTGLYNITFIANDTAGNLNITEKTNVSVEQATQTFVNVSARSADGTPLNMTVIFVNATGQTLVNIQNATVFSFTIPIGIYNITQIPVNQSAAVLNLTVANANISTSNISLVGIDYPNASSEFAKDVLPFAIDPTGLNFSTINVTANATKRDLYKCANWNFTGRYCGAGCSDAEEQAGVCNITADWRLVQAGVTPGQAYTFVLLNSSDPGYSEYTEATGENSTTSTAFVNKTVLTFVPTRAGNHTIIVSAELHENSATVSVLGRVLVDNVNVSDIRFEPHDAAIANDYEAYELVVTSDFNTSNHTVVIQWATSNAATAAFMRNARISVLETRNLENRTRNGPVSLGTTFAEVTNVTLTPGTADDYLILASGELQTALCTVSGVVRVQLDQTTINNASYECKDVTDYKPFFFHQVTNLTAGVQHNITLDALRTGSAGGEIRNTRLAAIRLTPDFDAQFAASDALATTTSATFVNKTNLTFVPTVAGDYLFIATAEFNTSLTTTQTRVNLDIDGTTVCNVTQEAEDLIDAMIFSCQSNTTLSAASHTATIKFAAQGGTAGIRNARITAIRLTADVTPPNVSSVRPVANNLTARNSVVNVSATVTDSFGVDIVLANITFPNGSIEQLRLQQMGNIYNFSFGNTSNEGYYNVTFIANDSVNNINSTERTNFTVDSTGPNVTIVSPPANTVIQNGTVVNISANVTDQFLTVDVVLANITYPDNTTKEQLRLAKVGNIYNFSFGNTTFQEGTYNITFIANDTAGNINSTQKTNFTIDIRNPIVNNVRPVANNFTATNSVVNISANVTNGIAVDTVRANVTFPNGSVVQLTLAQVGTIYNFSFGNTSNEGYYNITFIANDTVGNINSTERTNFTVDSTGPNVTVVSPPANTLIGNGTVINISANVTDQFLTVNVVLANITYPDNTTKEQLRLAKVGNIYNFSFGNTTFQEGTYNITFIANDTAGNLNTTQKTNFTIDARNPIVNNVRPVANNFTATNSVVNISANVTNGVAVDTVKANVTFPNGSVVQLTLVPVGTIYNFSFGNTSNEGYYNVTFIANDTVGNINSTERTNFTVDVTGPNVTTLRPVANSNQANGSVLNISATVIDQFLTVDVVLANITYPDNTTKEQLRLAKVGNIYNFSFRNTTQLGTYNITFIANDTAGNLNTTEKTNVTMQTVDITPPSVTNVRPVVNNVTGTNTRVNISATVTDDFTVDIVLANITFPNGTKQQLTLQKVGNIYNFTFNNTVIEGTYNVTFIANDTSNNINATERTNFTVDGTRPAIALTAPVDRFNTTSPNVTFTFTPTDNQAANMSCNLVVDSVVNNSNSSSVNNTLTTLLGFGFAEGNHNWNVSCTDIAGNSNTSFTRRFTVDQSAPAFITLTNIPTSEDDLDPNVTIAFYANVTENLTAVNTVFLQQKLSNETLFNNVTMTLNSSNGLYEASFTPTVNGTFNFRVFANDTLNNNGVSAQVNLSIQFDRTWTRTPVAFATGANQNKNISLVNITINNTGDFSLNFTITSSFANTTFNTSFPLQLAAKETRIVAVNATAPATIGATTVTLEINATPSASPSTLNTTVTLGVTQGEAFLAATLTTIPTSATAGNTITIEGRVQNIGTANATNGTIYFTIPSDWVVTGGSLNNTFGELVVGDDLLRTINVNIPTSATLGPRTVKVNATGRNESGTDLVPLNLVSGDERTVTVSAAPALGPGAGAEEEGGGGGGVGGGAPAVPGQAAATGGAVTETQSGAVTDLQSSRSRTELFNTSEVIYVVRGNKTEFLVNVTNIFNDSVMKNVKLNIQGYLSKYLSWTPQEIEEIQFDDMKQFLVTIEAPSYKPREEHNVTLTFTSEVFANYTRIIYNTRSRQNDTMITTVKTRVIETRDVTLIILETSALEADEKLALAEKYLILFNEKGIGTGRLEALVQQLREAYASEDFGAVDSVFTEIDLLASAALEAYDIIEETKQKYTEAEAVGYDVAYLGTLIQLAEAAMGREDFDSALLRAHEAQFYEISMKQQQFTLTAFLSDYWRQLLLSIMLFTLVAYVVQRRVFLVVVDKRLKNLDTEEEGLYNLKADTQKLCFVQKKISPLTYHQRMFQYENRIDEIHKLRFKLKRKQHIFVTKEDVARYLQRDILLLQNRIKQQQELYYNLKKIPKSIYERSVDAFKEQIAATEKELTAVVIAGHKEETLRGQLKERIRSFERTQGYGVLRSAVATVIDATQFAYLSSKKLAKQSLLFVRSKSALLQKKPITAFEPIVQEQLVLAQFEQKQPWSKTTATVGQRIGQLQSVVAGQVQQLQTTVSEVAKKQGISDSLLGINSGVQHRWEKLKLYYNTFIIKEQFIAWRVEERIKQSTGMTAASYSNEKWKLKEWTAARILQLVGVHTAPVPLSKKAAGYMSSKTKGALHTVMIEYVMVKWVFKEWVVKKVIDVFGAQALPFGRRGQLKVRR